jgi:hypothetical protein
MSESILISTEYTLVIHTDGFSDAFAKKLCAYCTGFVDETDTDLEFSDLYYLEENIEDDESPKGRVADEKNPFYGFVGQRLDEDQIYSPCCVWLNKRYGYNANGEYAVLTEKNFDEYNFPAPLSVGIFFDMAPEPEHISKIKERAVKFFEKVWPKLNDGAKKVTVEDFRLVIHTKYGEEVAV